MTRFLGWAALAMSTATPLSAAVTVHTETFITAPVAATDFEDIQAPSTPVNTVVNIGGLRMVYASTNNGQSTSHNGDDLSGGGLYGWRQFDNSGYTSISLATGASFNQIQFLASSGWASLGSPSQLAWEILFQGTVISTGAVSGVESFQETASYFGFSGETFDEVRIKGPRFDQFAFIRNGTDALGIDNVSIGLANAGIPEPSTWVMMVLGFGLIGGAVRRSRKPDSPGRYSLA